MAGKKDGGHWTDNVRVNNKFKANMLKATKGGRFTNRDGYQVYAEHHKDTNPFAVVFVAVAEDDVWLQMNVRNQFCKWEHDGILRRIEPGVYEWSS